MLVSVWNPIQGSNAYLLLARSTTTTRVITASVEAVLAATFLPRITAFSGDIKTIKGPVDSSVAIVGGTDTAADSFPPDRACFLLRSILRGI